MCMGNCDIQSLEHGFKATHVFLCLNEHPGQKENDGHPFVFARHLKAFLTGRKRQMALNSIGRKKQTNLTFGREKPSFDWRGIG